MKDFLKEVLWAAVGTAIVFIPLNCLTNQKINEIEKNSDYDSRRIDSFFKDGADHCSWFSMNKEMQIKVFGDQIKVVNTNQPVEVAHFYMCSNYKNWSE